VLRGPNVVVGSTAGVASIVTQAGSIAAAITRGPRNRGAFTVANSASGLYASRDLLIGVNAKRDVRPAAVTIAGNLTAGRNLTLIGRGDVLLEQFRLRAGGIVSVSTVNNLTGTGGDIISGSGKSVLVADSDKDGVGRARLGGVGISDTIPGALQASFGDVEMQAPLRRGKTGTAEVNVTNIGAALFSGPVTIRVYASSDTLLDAPDILLGSITRTVTGIKAGKTGQFTVPLTIPFNLEAGIYKLVAQISPFTAGSIKGPITAPVDTNIGVGPNITLFSSDIISGPKVA